MEHEHFWGGPRDPETGLYRCACGETKTLWQIFISGSPMSTPGLEWYLTPNVIEGEHFFEAEERQRAEVRQYLEPWARKVVDKDVEEYFASDEERHSVKEGA